MRNRKEYFKQYYLKNREKLLEYQRNDREENPEKIKNIKKKYRRKNRDKIKKYNREYEKTENAKERNGRYERTDKFKETNENWNKSEKGKASRQRRHFNRQVRERKGINTLTAQEWLDILEDYGYKCAYCGCEFDENNLLTKDHIIPISKDGNNVKENMVPACKRCNSKKKDKLDFSLAKGEV